MKKKRAKKIKLKLRINIFSKTFKNLLMLLKIFNRYLIQN